MDLYPSGRFGWDPFADMRRLQAEMNRMFEGVSPAGAGRGYPPVNVWLGDNSVAVTAELPGLAQDDIELSVRDDTLTIQGERKPPSVDENASWHRRERGYGSFARTVALPFRVDPEQVRARFADGVLEVEMQRPKADLPRKIEITAS